MTYFWKRTTMLTAGLQTIFHGRSTEKILVCLQWQQTLENLSRKETCAYSRYDASLFGCKHRPRLLRWHNGAVQQRPQMSFHCTSTQYQLASYASFYFNYNNILPPNWWYFQVVGLWGTFFFSITNTKRQYYGIYYCFINKMMIPIWCLWHRIKHWYCGCFSAAAYERSPLFFICILIPGSSSICQMIFCHILTLIVGVLCKSWESSHWSNIFSQWMSQQTRS